MEPCSWLLLHFAWWRKWFRAASCALFALIGMIAGDLASLAPVHYGADSAGGVRSGRVEDVAATPYNQRLAVKLDSGERCWHIIMLRCHP